MNSVKSQLLATVPGMIHGFGTFAEPVPASLQKVWEEKRPNWKQVHGVEIAEAREPHAACGEVDAIWTRVREVPIAVVTADCVPVLLARRDGKVAAAVHAGWRGTRAGILRKLWEKLSVQGESPQDWV